MSIFSEYIGLQFGRADIILELIVDMVDSKIVQIAYHANDPNVGLANEKDLRGFKLFLTDIGESI